MIFFIIAGAAGDDVAGGLAALLRPADQECALRHGLTVLHHDRDFEALARVSPLTAQKARLRPSRKRGG